MHHVLSTSPSYRALSWHAAHTARPTTPESTPPSAREMSISPMQLDGPHSPTRGAGRAQSRSPEPVSPRLSPVRPFDLLFGGPLVSPAAPMASRAPATNVAPAWAIGQEHDTLASELSWRAWPSRARSEASTSLRPSHRTDERSAWRHDPMGRRPHHGVDVPTRHAGVSPSVLAPAFSPLGLWPTPIEPLAPRPRQREAAQAGVLLSSAAPSPTLASVPVAELDAQFAELQLRAPPPSPNEALAPRA